MATGKRYYWMKLKESFMTSDVVDFFMGQPDGANYVVLYQMLCLMTLKTGGKLSRQIGEVIIPYDVAKIQRDTKWFTLDTIRVALELYKRFGLVYEDIDGNLALADYSNLVGSETDYAAQKKMQRIVAAQLESARNDTIADDSADTGVDNFSEDVHIDIRDKILDNRDKDIDINISNNCVSEDKYSKDFEEFWKIYPRKVDKGNAYKKYKARLNDGYSPQELLSAVKGYCAEIKKLHTQSEYIKHPKTFLSDALPFLDYLPKTDCKGNPESNNPFERHFGV